MGVIWNPPNVVTRHFRSVCIPIKKKEANCIVTSRKFSFEKILHFPIDKGVADKITHRNVEERAYFLWLESGKPEGRDKEFWLQAEKEMNSVRFNPQPPEVSPLSNVRKNLILEKPAPKDFRKIHHPSFTDPQTPSPEILRTSNSLSRNHPPDSVRSPEDKFMDQLFGSVFEEVDFDGLFNTCASSP